MSYDPTHVVVAVQRAKDLISKGKNGTNDAFVTIALAENKFQTTIKDKTIDPEWYEECDVPLPDNYNQQKLTLQIFHRNNLGIDQFLGHLDLALQNFDVYDPPKSIWYPLVCKPGQDKSNPRGELEIRISFEVKKIKDMDSLSVTSSASKRFKMSKKSIKHAASALGSNQLKMFHTRKKGRKVKGPKNEKTKDYIPDLNELPTGALSLDDIAENYSAPLPKSSLSNTPSSPAFVRSSPRSSKGYSPFSKRKSRADPETPTSSNASVEDIKQKTDDADSYDGSFVRTHRRGGSGSDAVLRAQKPNRRLLTARPISTSAADVSITTPTGDEGSVGDRNSGTIEENTNSIQRTRMRSATSSSQISNEVLPEESTATINISHKRNSSVASSKALAEQPVLIDDDSDDSMEGYTPSPIIPLVKNAEPDDIFTRMAAQQELEKEDEFNLVKHEVMPGEQVFTPIGKLQPEPAAAAHSTPITVEDRATASLETSEPVIKSKPPIAGGAAKEKKSKDKKKKKVAVTPAINVFDLLMASDEPEFNVDDTLPDGRRSNDRLADSSELNPFGEEKEEDSNPFGEPVVKSDNQFVSIAKQSKLIEDTPADTIPFDEPKGAIQSAQDSNLFDEAETADANPFGAPETPVDDTNPFGPSKKADEDLNPFGEPSIPEKINKSENPFDEPAKETSTNPFGNEEKNPFSEQKKNVISQSAVSNPFQDDTKSITSNPFEDDEDEESGSFNRTGSFARHGSSRFAGSGRNKKRKEKKKSAAPAPPKPERLKPGVEAKIEGTASEKPTVTEMNPEYRLSIKSNYFSLDSPRNSESPQVASVESPRQKYKKDKKAPRAPGSPSISKLIESTPPKARSFSHNPVTDAPAETKRRDTDPSRMESIINTSGSLSPSRQERQPAVGAEAPDVPSEPRATVDAQVQVSLPNTQEHVPSEFRHHSKSELVEMVQKLRQQIRKKEEHTKDLEQYIDSLLARVMSADPNLLVNLSSCGQQAAQTNKLR